MNILIISPCKYTTESGFKQSAVLEQRGKFKKLYFNPKLHEGNSQVGEDSKEGFLQHFKQRELLS